MVRRIVLAGLIFAGIALILYLYWPSSAPVRPSTTPAVVSAIGGPFTLSDPKGNPVTEAVLQGHYSLIYFGYTFCPDICPLALQTMTQALEMAGPVAEEVLPIFITIDPERDTAEVVGTYVAHFHPKFLGLTGTPEQIRAAEKSYGVYAAKSATTGPAEKAGGDYVMDHTGRTYLMDRQGKNVAHFGKDATAAEIANRLRRELNPR